MRRTINLIQFGLGNVGTRLLELVHNLKQDDVEIRYIAVAEKEGGVVDTDGIEIETLISAKKRLAQLKGFERGLEGIGIIKRIASKNVRDCVAVDVTASDNMAPVIKQALHSGYHVVLSNKKPLSASFKDFEDLQKAAKAGESRLLFECTVGAGLPIIYVLRSLLATGDEIIEVNGCFSGTLGYIFSELEKNRKFSSVVREARQTGYTEPDPRDDLSGLDVARKAIILSRLCGLETELEDVHVESLVPGDLRDVTIDTFLKKLPDYDASFSQRYGEAAEKGNTLRYVASIRSGEIGVGLKEVPINHPLGNLKGPLNICAIRSKRYNSYPLVIQGPGAGRDVTADGVLRDILVCAD